MDILPHSGPQCSLQVHTRRLSTGMFDFRRAAMGLWRRQLVSARGFCACDGVPSPDAEVSCPWQLLHTSTVSFEAAGAVTQNTNHAVTKSGFRTNQKTMHTYQHCPSHLYQSVWYVYMCVHDRCVMDGCACEHACVCVSMHVCYKFRKVDHVISLYLTVSPMVLCSART